VATELAARRNAEDCELSICDRAYGVRDATASAAVDAVTSDAKSLSRHEFLKIVIGDPLKELLGGLDCELLN
jgi:hypothetical protein